MSNPFSVGGNFNNFSINSNLNLNSNVRVPTPTPTFTAPTPTFATPAQIPQGGNFGHSQVSSFTPAPANSSPVFRAPAQSPVTNAVFSAPAQNPVNNTPFRAPAQSPVNNAVFSAPAQNPVFSAPAQNPVFSAPAQNPVFSAPAQNPVNSTRAQNPVNTTPFVTSTPPPNQISPPIVLPTQQPQQNPSGHVVTGGPTNVQITNQNRPSDQGSTFFLNQSGPRTTVGGSVTGAPNSNGTAPIVGGTLHGNVNGPSHTQTSGGSATIGVVTNPNAGRTDTFTATVGTSQTVVPVQAHPSHGAIHQRDTTNFGQFQFDTTNRGPVNPNTNTRPGSDLNVNVGVSTTNSTVVQNPLVGSNNSFFNGRDVTVSGGAQYSQGSFNPNGQQVGGVSVNVSGTHSTTTNASNQTTHTTSAALGGTVHLGQGASVNVGTVITPAGTTVQGGATFPVGAGSVNVTGGAGPTGPFVQGGAGFQVGRNGSAGVEFGINSAEQFIRGNVRFGL